MARFDMPLEEMRAYRPQVREPADFDKFWARTLAASRAVGGRVRAERVEGPVNLADIYDVTFPGYAGEPVRAWLAVPAGADAPLPTVVEYRGYGNGRGLAHEAVGWALAGFAYLRMDTRGQGAMYSVGGTDDPEGSGPAIPGMMTRGIESPATYYYTRLVVDAVRAVDALGQLPCTDAGRVTVTGDSQGGAMTLAVAGLVDSLVAACPNVAFLCNLERAIGLTDNDPYAEVNRYLRVHRDKVEQTFETLSYLDGVNFARRATAPALFSTGLQDQIAPPSTVFAAFNAYGAPGSAGAADKDIVVYPFNDHEGGEGFQWPRQVEFVNRHLPGAGTQHRVTM